MPKFEASKQASKQPGYRENGSSDGSIELQYPDDDISSCYLQPGRNASLQILLVSLHISRHFRANATIPIHRLPPPLPLSTAVIRTLENLRLAVSDRIIAGVWKGHNCLDGGHSTTLFSIKLNASRPLAVASDHDILGPVKTLRSLLLHSTPSLSAWIGRRLIQDRSANVDSAFLRKLLLLAAK